jgi:hypothetical protein
MPPVTEPIVCSGGAPRRVAARLREPVLLGVALAMASLVLSSCADAEPVPLTEETAPDDTQISDAAARECAVDAALWGDDEPAEMSRVVCAVSFEVGATQAVEASIADGLTAFTADSPGLCLDEECLEFRVQSTLGSYPRLPEDEVTLAAKDAYVAGVRWVQEDVIGG